MKCVQELIAKSRKARAIKPIKFNVLLRQLSLLYRCNLPLVGATALAESGG
jgi:hypothetical protein